MPYGQQAAIFATDVSDAAPLIDILGNVVGRINLNTQCARSPDTLPFSGRRSSAVGTMSITEALKNLSVETLVATKDQPNQLELMKKLDGCATFLKKID